MQEITIDATNQILGRIASQIAMLLMGKDSAAFVPYRIPERMIIVKNVARIKVTGRKATDKLYQRHSMYPGGLKSVTLGQQMERDPRKVLEWAVYGMLPKNKLRSQMMKNLKIHP